MDPITQGYLISSGIGLLGGLLSGAAEGEMTEAQMRQRLQELAAQLGMDEAKFTEMLRAQQGKLGLDAANQVPNRVGWRQNQALSAAILPGLRNTEVTSNIPGMNSFIPKVSGGLRIPEGGFGPETLKFFGDNAMLTGEADLDRAAQVATDGRASVTDYGSIYGSAGETQETAMGAISSQLKSDAAEREKKRRAAIEKALGRPNNSALVNAVNDTGGRI